MQDLELGELRLGQPARAGERLLGLLGERFLARFPDALRLEWTGTAKVGTFRPSDGTFYLDYNGSGAWDGCATDRCLSIGLNGDIPLVGDWDGTGPAKVRLDCGVGEIDVNLK